MPTDFTPLQSLFGGMLIGLAATLLMLLHGRIAGITGIIAGLLPPYGAEANAGNLWWRAAFVAGLVASPLAYAAIFKAPIALQVAGSPMLLAVSGAIVGVGVSYGAGCPSGHGVCGLARFSARSFAATLMFMASAAVTVFVVRHVLGA
jgi:uncharacterized protein